MKYSLLIIMASISLAGCTWVEPIPDSVHVRVLYHAQVKHCKQVGRTTVSVLDSIAFIPRSQAQVSEELETLARNSAVEIDGDSVVAISKIIDGEQVYQIYQCKDQ